MGKNLTIWIDDRFDRSSEGILIRTEDIEEKAYISYPGIRVWEDVNRYNFKKEVKSKLEEFAKKVEIKQYITVNDKDVITNYLNLQELLDLEPEIEELEELLDVIVGYEGVSYSSEYIPRTNYLAFDFYNYVPDVDSLEECFFAVDDLDMVLTYSWHDGSNWRLETNENVIEYNIILADKEKYNLDIHDGNNFNWSGKFDHANLHKIEILDDEKVDNYVLWETWTQWQGYHDLGEVMTFDEAIERLIEEEHPEIEEIKKWLDV